jgi:uncharacterized protein
MGESEMNTSIPKYQAILSHLSALFCPILFSLIIFLFSRDNYTKRNAKEALIFQSAIILCGIISALLCFSFVGFLLLLVLAIINLIFSMIATFAAANGNEYSYPITGRFATKH